MAYKVFDFFKDKWMILSDSEYAEQINNDIKIFWDYYLLRHPEIKGKGMGGIRLGIKVEDNV